MDKKIKEQPIISKESFYETIYEAIDDGVILIDTKGKVVAMNKKLEEITGYPPDEVVGKTFDKLSALKISDLPKFLKLFAEILISGKTHKNFEIEIKRKDGVEIFLEASTGFARKNGKIVGDVVALRDVTERKRMQKELEEKNIEFEKRINLMEGRELKMAELKKEIERLNKIISDNKK